MAASARNGLIRASIFSAAIFIAFWPIGKNQIPLAAFPARRPGLPTCWAVSPAAHRRTRARLPTLSEAPARRQEGPSAAALASFRGPRHHQKKLLRVGMQVNILIAQAHP